MKNTEDLIHSLEDIFKRYELAIKKYHPTFAHDTQHLLKINEILRHLTESPKTPILKSNPNDKDKDKKNSSPVYQFKDKEKEELNLKL